MPNNLSFKDIKPAMVKFEGKASSYVRSTKFYNSATLYNKNQVYYGGAPIEGDMPEMVSFKDIKPLIMKVESL